MPKRRRDQRLPRRSTAPRPGQTGPVANRPGAAPPAAPSWRDRLPGRGAPAAPGRQRRVSRRQREARRQRLLIWAMAITGAIVVVILAGFASWDYLIKPRQVVASVNGAEIRRRDYWKVRANDLVNQATQFQQLAQFTSDPQQQSQYRSLAQQAVTELEDVWGSTSLDDTTLQKMIDDQVYLQNLDDLGLSVSEEDVDNFILQQFEPPDAPLFTPTPTQTLIPARAAWATETAAARTATAAATPEAQASPEALDAEATPATTPETTPESSSAGAPVAENPVASPDADASPVAEASPASPEATATLQPTPNPEQAIQTAEAGYAEFRENVFDETHMSRGDYERLVARPAVARQKVRGLLESRVGQSAEQVRAAHILISTKDLADSIYQQLQQPGIDFAQVARDNSTDTATAPNGGDLGWFPRGIMVAAFDDVAFATSPGQFSQPFQTQFGWHILTVFAKEPDRPLTDDQISQLKTSSVEKWLEDRRADADIDSDIDPTPTPADSVFEPPPDAPPTPTLAPTPEATPELAPSSPVAASPAAAAP